MSSQTPFSRKTLTGAFPSPSRNGRRPLMSAPKTPPASLWINPIPVSYTHLVQEEREKIDPATQKPVIGADGKAVTETVEVLRPAFKVVSVFDVSQTDGKELPDIIVDELKGTVENDVYKRQQREWLLRRWGVISSASS